MGIRQKRLFGILVVAVLVLAGVTVASNKIKHKLTPEISIFQDAAQPPLKVPPIELPLDSFDIISYEHSCAAGCREASYSIEVHGNGYMRYKETKTEDWTEGKLSPDEVEQLLAAINAANFRYIAAHYPKLVDCDITHLATTNLTISALGLSGTVSHYGRCFATRLPNLVQLEDTIEKVAQPLMSPEKKL